MTYDHQELMALHVEALFIHDSRGDLLHVNEPNGGPAPRFFLGRTSRGCITRCRADVEPDMRREIAATVEAQGNALADLLMSHDDPATYERILARSAPVQNTWLGCAYCVHARVHARGPESTGAVMVDARNADVLRDLLDGWIPDVQTGQPMAAVVADGRAVSVCCSVRRTERAHEAGVETAPAYRGRGYAARVVAAWAHAVRELGVVPLYSTAMHNAASNSVASRLSMLRFGIDMHFT